MKPIVIAGACLALSLLTWLQFPGHSWLQQDSQIYAPILEHLRDPSVLRNDILAQKAHVAYTLYDETARALRAATRLDFRDVLAIEQILSRACGIWGLYLCAAGLLACFPVGKTCNPAHFALFITAICSLGAIVSGPSVLTFEYEPTPRAFALPLAICATGLTVHRRYLAAGIALAAALVYHAPTALPFVLFFIALSLWPSKSENLRRRIVRLAPLAGAVLLLAVAAHVQEGAGEAQSFFARLTPGLERLQRLRASYNWISDAQPWPPALLAHYAILFAILLAAFFRLRRDLSFELRLFSLGLPIVGMLSLPVSWLLLDHWRLAIVPQLQPMRCILFVTLFAQFLTAAAGVRAALRRQPVEAIAWFALAYLPPVQPVMTSPYTTRGIAVVLSLALLAWLAVWLAQAKRQPAALALVLAAFFAIPGIARVVNYPRLLTPELDQLSTWARSATPKDAVFQFADAGKGLDPGIFRAQALRAIYVDWKGGGQVNYLSGFAAEWWRRWLQTNQNRFKPRDLPKYAALGIRYIVVQPKNRLKDRPPAFESPHYLAYALP
jgi:hypothetical protein